MDSIRKKIFVTGGSSFLGNELINKLASSYEVIALENKSNLKSDKVIRVVRGNLENKDIWESSLTEAEIVIHLAGITHTKNLSLYSKINTLGTISLINSCKKFGVKQFIFISTRAIGKNSGEYGASKEKAEDYLKNSGLVYTILRVSEAYDENFNGKEGLSRLANLIKRSSIAPYLTNKEVTLAPIHKDDVQNSILAVINNQSTKNKTYTIAGPENLTLKQIASRIGKYYKINIIFIPIPTFIAKSTFFILSLFRLTTPDQMQRMLSPKEPLSQNVLADLNISPRKFLV